MVTPIVGAYTATTGTLNGGTWSITARTADVAGNVGVSDATTVRIDYDAPTPDAPVLAAASDTGRSSSDEITNDTTPTFIETPDAGEVAVRLFAGGVEVGSGPASPSYAVTSSALADGSHSMTVKLSDLAGNESSASPARVVRIDTVAPPAPSAPHLTASSDSGSSSSDRITNDTTPTVTGSNELSALVTVLAGTAPVGTDITTNTSYSVITSALSEGEHTLAATATDSAGNLGPASTGTTIVIDTTPPTPPSAPAFVTGSDSGFSSSDGITSVRTPTFTGTAEVGTTVRLYSGSSPTGVLVTAIGGTYTITTELLSEGTRVITARTSADVAGNVGISGSTTARIDTTAPTVILDESSSSPIQFKLTFSEPIRGLTSEDVVLGGSALPTASTVSGSGLVYFIDVTEIQRSGNVTARLDAGAAEDLAGNLSLASTSSDNTVGHTDSTAPEVSITSFTAAPSQAASVGGTAGRFPGDPASVTVVLCTTSDATCSGANTKATLVATVDPVTGDWSVTSDSLGTTAVLYARAVATDLTGNLRRTPAAGPIAIP
jgi:hypothetical protein